MATIIRPGGDNPNPVLREGTDVDLNNAEAEIDLGAPGSLAEE